MTRTMVYLDDTVHRRLRHLAVERHTSLAALIREAVDSLYKEDMEDIRIGRQRLSDYLAHSEQGVSYASYRARRNLR